MIVLVILSGLLASNADDVAYIVTVDVAPEPILSYPKNSQWQEVFNPTWYVCTHIFCLVHQHSLQYSLQC